MIHLFLKHREQRWTKHHDIMIFCLMDQWNPMNPLPQPSPRRCPHRFRPRWDQYRRVSTLRWIAPLVTMFVVWDGPGLTGGVLMEVSTATAATVSRWIRPSGKSSCNPLRGGQAVRSLRGRSAMLRSISCGHGRLTIGKSPHIPTENHNEPHWARVGSPLCKAWYCKQAATLDFLGVSCLIFPQRPEHYQSPLLHIRQRHTSWFDQAKKSKSCIPVLQPDKNRTESLKAQGRPRFEAHDLITLQLLRKWSLVFGATKALGFSWLAISAWHLLCSLIRSFMTRNVSSNHFKFVRFEFQVPNFFECYCEIFYLWYCKKNLVNAARGESKETFQVRSWFFNLRDSKNIDRNLPSASTLSDLRHPEERRITCIRRLVSMTCRNCPCFLNVSYCCFNTMKSRSQHTYKHLFYTFNWLQTSPHNWKNVFFRP